jgi:hypothetical protein
VHRILATIPALLALGCAGAPSITTNRDPAVPIPAAPTWSWGRHETKHQAELDPSAQNPILHQWVQVAIEETLAKKGWKQVHDTADAQLVLTYHIGIKRDVVYQTSTTAMGGGWYGGYGWGYYGAPTYAMSTTTPVDYTQGGLLVYVHERVSGKVAWYGLFKKDVHDPDKITQQGVRTAVSETLQDLK